MFHGLFIIPTLVTNDNNNNSNDNNNDLGPFDVPKVRQDGRKRGFT